MSGMDAEDEFGIEAGKAAECAEIRVTGYNCSVAVSNPFRY